MSEKEIKALEMTRAIRDKMYEEEKDLSFEEIQKKRMKELEKDEIWQKLKKNARPAGSRRNGK